MTENDHTGGSEDPLELYRQALNRRQSPETTTRSALAEFLVSQGAQSAVLDEAQDVTSPEDPLAGQDPQLAALNDAQDVTLPDDPLAGEDPQSAVLDEAQDVTTLADPLAGEDPQPAALDGAQGVAEPDEDLPSDLQDTYARYQKALDKLKDRQEEVVAPLTAPPEAQDGPPPGRGRTEGRSGDPLTRYRQAVGRRQDIEQRPGRASAKHAAEKAAPRETLDQFRKARTKRPETSPEAHAVARPRGGGQRVVGAPLDWRIRAVVFAVLLLANPPIQWLVHTRLDTPFAPLDLVAGLSAVLPAALILFGARPGSFRGRFVTVIGSMAVGLIGSAGFAFGLSLLQNELPDGASLALGLLLSLGVFTAVWGPLFLILAPVLARMNHPAQGRA